MSNPPIQIFFHHLDSSPALEEHIRSDVAKLESCFDHITRCHVTVEKLGHGHLHGAQFEIRVEVSVPGGPLVVRHRAPPEEDAFVATRAAFQVVRRRLDDYRRLRDDNKHHSKEQ